MRKFTRIAAFALALCMSGAAFTACGEKKSEEKEIESAIDSMDEKELESKIEEAAEKLDKDEKEEATEATTEVTGYAPTDEIKKASFESGLIQIGNDIFHQGGYYTVSQFFEEYSDRYDFYNDYFDEKEFNADGIYDKLKNFDFDIVAKNDLDNLISVSFKPLNEEGKTSVGDCIVTYVDEISFDVPSFYPQHKEEIKYTDVEPFLDSLGYKKKEADNGKYEYDCYWYIEKSSTYPEGDYLYVRSNEKNLFGNYSVYEYRFLIDVETGLSKVDAGGTLPSIWVIDTDVWSSAKESE